MSLLSAIGDFITPGVGSALAAGLSFIGGERRNAAAAEQSDTQMQFQERMSSTAYQRAMVDMRAAGLNPMLAYQQGGASSPAGAMAPVEDTLTPAVSTGMQSRRLSQELKNMAATEDQTRMSEKMMKSQAMMYEAQETKAKTETLLLAQELPEAQAVADFYKKYGGNAIPVREWLRAGQGIPASALQLLKRRGGGLTINK